MDVPEVVERVLGEGTFTVAKFAESFGALVEAAGGPQKLRSLVLELAVRGCLDAQSQIEPSPTTDATTDLADLPFALPPSWEWQSLGSLAVATDYGTSQKAHSEPSGIPVIRMNNIQDRRLDLNSLKYVPKSTDGLPALLLQSGDLLFNRTNSFELVGKMAVFREAEKFTFASYLIRVRLGNRAIPEYVNCYFGSLTCRDSQIVPNITKQTNQANFNGTKLKAVMVPLPPLAEQKRIVARVDQLMALIDQLEAKENRKREVGARFTKASLEALTTAESPQEFTTAWTRIQSTWSTILDRPDKVGELKRVVLELAFSGRLAQERAGDTPVARIVQSIEEGWSGFNRKEVLTDVADDEIPISPSRWKWIRLGNLAEVIGGVTKGRDLRGRKLSSIPYLRVANVQQGFLDLTEMKEIEIPAEELPKYRLEIGDVLFTEGGDWDKLGRSGVWVGEIKTCIHQNHVFRARLVSDFLAPAWVSAFANSSLGRRYFENAAKRTTNLASINMTQLRNCPIPVPPVEERERIVAKVEQLLKLCDALEVALRRSEDRAAKLVEAVVQEMVA